MSTPTVPLRERIAAPVSATDADTDVGVLEQARGRGWHRLRFDDPLERCYEHDGRKARAWRHIVCNLVGGAAFWLLSSAGPTTVLPGAPFVRMRIAVAAIAALLVLLLWLTRHVARDAFHDSLTACGTLAVAAYAFISSHWLGNDLAPLMRGSGLLLIFLHVGIGARLQFRFALGVTVVVLVGNAAFSARGNPGLAPVFYNHLMLFGVVATFSTVGNFVLERRERQSYLLRRLNGLRHDALLADAVTLRELTVRDGLTQLHNRRHFDAELDRACAVAERAAGPLGLLQVDVDHFKRYNDRYGHPAGDRCLAAVAAALAAVAARHGGLAARVGGEEFALLLPGHDDRRTADVAEACCDAVRLLGLPHGGSTTAPMVTVSVGAVAIAAGVETTAAALVGAADVALYLAKSRGRNRAAVGEAPSDRADAPRPERRPGPAARQPDAPTGDALRIERLSGLLANGLRRLRFPSDLETEFQERGAEARRRQVAYLTVVGLFAPIVYIVFCRPMIPDIAGRLLQHLLALSIVGLTVAAAHFRIALGWRLREGSVAASLTAFGLVIVWIESQSRSTTVYSATLGLCLVPMFSSLVFAQPLRFCLLPAVFICGAVATCMQPASLEQRGNWLFMLGVLIVATLYSLLGGYLLEVANRRGYLLDQLRIAQSSVLERNTRDLKQLATIDPMTGLPNRRHFEAELERLAAEAAVRREPLALLILDVDHFKQYNDGYGHPAGDACLQRIGAALLRWVEATLPPPVVARIGGEEFAVLLPGRDAVAALATAQRLRLLLNDLRIDHAHSPVGRHLTVSLGAASRVMGSAADARALLQAADAALYRAKGSGRDSAAA